MIIDYLHVLQDINFSYYTAHWNPTMASTVDLFGVHLHYNPSALLFYATAEQPFL